MRISYKFAHDAFATIIISKDFRYDALSPFKNNVFGPTRCLK